MKTLFVLFFLTLSCALYACDCSPVSAYKKRVKIAYSEADVVILSTVESVNKKENQVYLKVLESYKGINKDTLVISDFGSCSVYLKSGDVWLLYLKKINGRLKSNQCLPNQNFQKMNLLSLNPQQKNLKSKDDSYFHTILLQQELISLRQKKILNQENNSNSFYSENKNELMLILLVINTILLSLLIREVRIK